MEKKSNLELYPMHNGGSPKMQLITYLICMIIILGTAFILLCLDKIFAWFM